MPATVAAVELCADGTCRDAKGGATRRTVVNGSRVYTHYEDETLKLLSSVSIDAVQHERVEVYDHVLPPPLNKYIYPLPLYAMRSDGGGMCTADFVERCARYAQQAEPQQLKQVVYDVIAAPMVDDEDDVGDESDDETSTESVLSDEGDSQWETDSADSSDVSIHDD